MTKIKKIYLDMDGVLVDNILGLAHLENTTIDGIQEQKSNIRKNNPDIDFVIQLIRKHLYTNKHFSTCPPMKEFHVFTKLIRQWLSNGLHVEILSSGTSGKDIFHEVCRQKDEWLDTWGLSILPAHYAMGSSEKQKWAAPDILLIDDYGKNIDEFRAAGGHAIQHLNMNDTIVQLQELNLI